MVMKRNAMRRNLQQSIVKSFGRYIAIILIIALGAALFLGLLMTKADMVATGQVFMDEQNMFDIRVMNLYGWKQEHLDAVLQIDGVVEAEKVEYLDLLASVDKADAAVYRFLTIPEKMNKVALRGGRMPQKADECLADGFFYGDQLLGKKVTVAQDNAESSLDSMLVQEFTVVGYVATPLYMDMNRGTTSVGSGSLSTYFYIPEEAMDLEYIPEICLTIPGEYAIYTDTYNDALDAAADDLEPELQKLADHRLEQVKQGAFDAYHDGLKEYQEGLVEYAEGKSKADKELADAYQKLVDGEQEIIDNEKKLTDGEKQIKEAKQTLVKGKQSLLEGKRKLAASKATAYKELSAKKMALMEELAELTEELEKLEELSREQSDNNAELDDEVSALEAELATVNSNILMYEQTVETLNATISILERNESESGGIFDFLPSVSESELQSLKDMRDSYLSELDSLYIRRNELNAQLEVLYPIQEEQNREEADLDTQKTRVEAAITELTTSLMTIAATEAIMDDEFSAAEEQIVAAELQLTAGELQLEEEEKKIAEGWIALEEGKVQLQDGWKEYEKGKAEAELELADGMEKLQQAGIDLAEGWDTIQKMTENPAIIVDRRSNVGYNNLRSSSDIVQGVSRVLPVFFLLVASLVCITTMTRMVDEERTQIGTLKALGYSNAAIIGKYLFYSGSGAVIGCGIGVSLGTALLPSILWEAYQIMLYIKPRLVLTVNWPICIGVVGVYTAILMLVTWYCCRRALEEEPAELIRPKSPDAGKKLLVEYLPIWRKISFLNKVTIRNIFRYRQRLAMMLVGIGGCTALLLTGYGLRDSILNVVDFQFANVTLYDLEVYFREPVTEEIAEDFLEKLPEDAQSMFYHQSSVDLISGSEAKEILMISADEKLTEFVKLRSGQKDISLPGLNEVVISVGASEMMNIKAGDTIQLRNLDLKTMELTVSGIYDNHISNYCIVSPETIEAQYGEIPKQEMAFVMVSEDVNVHTLAADISELMDVMNVSIAADMADMVKGMMDALDLVIVVVVVSAALLAITVLYNLTNININERLREIATIKVLGFRSSETGAYVFKENMTLTVVGALFGLLLGKLLLWFVMTQIRIDMVWFRSSIMPASYVWSILLTLIAAIAVDFVFYFKLQTINMAEALKSVE